jgi:glyoxylase I family protein
MFNKIHHTAIICSDYKKSKEFYVEKLKLKIISETYRTERQSFKLDLAIGEKDQLELFSFPDAPERASYPEARGLRHLAFEVNDIESTIRALEKKGIAVEPVRVDELTGKKFSFFQDPDGLPLELYEK